MHRMRACGDSESRLARLAVAIEEKERLARTCIENLTTARTTRNTRNKDGVAARRWWAAKRFVLL